MEYEYACCPNGDCRQVCVPSQRGWSVTNGQTAARGVIEASLRARREFTVARSKWIVAVGVPRRSLPICGCSRSNSGAVCCKPQTHRRNGSSNRKAIAEPSLLPRHARASEPLESRLPERRLPNRRTRLCRTQLRGLWWVISGPRLGILSRLGLPSLSCFLWLCVSASFS